MSVSVTLQDDQTQMSSFAEKDDKKGSNLRLATSAPRPDDSDRLTVPETRAWTSP